MTPEVMLNHRLGQAARRLRLLLIYRWMARTLCWTAVACLLWALASRFNWVEPPATETLALLLAVAAAAGAGFGMATRLSLLDVARLTDRRTELKERLASAVEFQSLAATDPILRRQVQDAGAHAQSMDLRKVYPLRLSREAAIAAIITLALFLALLLPRLPIFWSAEHKREVEQVKKQGLAIEKIARDTQKAADRQKLDESKKAAEEAKKLAQAMKQGKLSKKDSLIRMQKLTAKLQEQHKRLAMAATPAPKSMEKAAEEFKRALEQQQKAIQDEAKANREAGKRPGESKQGGKKPGENGRKPGEQKKMTASMQKAQEAMRKFAEALAKQDAQMQNQALQEMADQVQKGEMTSQEMQQLQQQMKELSQALSKTDLDKVSKQLAELAKLMEQMKLDPETLKRLAQMMRQAGGT